MTRTGIAVAGSILGPSVITALAFIGNATVQPTRADPRATAQCPASSPGAEAVVPGVGAVFAQPPRRLLAARGVPPRPTFDLHASRLLELHVAPLLQDCQARGACPPTTRPCHPPDHTADSRSARCAERPTWRPTDR
jgi:hypothetical protein